MLTTIESNAHLCYHLKRIDFHIQLMQSDYLQVTTGMKILCDIHKVLSIFSCQITDGGGGAGGLSGGTKIGP